MTTSKPLSASQVSTWRHCRRKWGFEYIHKLRPAKGAGLALGTKIHKILEDHFRGLPVDMEETLDIEEKDGTTRQIRPGLIAQSALHLLPPAPQPEAHLEGTIAFDAVGHNWTGQIDLIVKGPGPWIVYDHKTTKSFRYMKTAEELAKDPQAIIYATYALYHSGFNQVDLSWTYLLTRGEPKAKAVRLTVLQDELVSGWETLKKDADGIKEAREHQDIEKLPRNLLACSDYGGCPHATYCLGDNVSFNKLLEEKLNAVGVTVSEPPPAPDSIAPTTRPTPAPAQEVVYLDLRTASRDQLKAEAMRRGLVDASSKLGAEKLRAMLEDPNSALTPPPQPASRPAARASSPLPVPPPPPTPLETTADTGFVLYIDCVPTLTNEQVVNGAQYFADVYDTAAESLKLPDARLADFGRGGAAIRACAKAFVELKRAEMDGKAFVIPSATHADLISILEPAAARVVRGVR